MRKRAIYEDTLHIKWATGEMTIILDTFFPTSQNRIKKLIKIIMLDWQNQDNLIAQLIAYLRSKRNDCNVNHRWTDADKYRRNLDIMQKI